MDQLAGLSEEIRKLALDRFRLLQPHLEDGRPLKLVAAKSGIPFRTAQRWVALYHQFGLSALARKRRADSGEHPAVSLKIREAIEGFALQKPPLPITAICRQVRRLASGLGEKPPSYWVVYRIVSGLPADLVTLAHQGSKAYSESFELICRREADRPNAIWQADHTPLDILLVRSDGQAAKPWLTVVIDDYSRAVAGYFLSFEAPSALHTSLALRLHHSKVVKQWLAEHTEQIEIFYLPSYSPELNPDELLNADLKHRVTTAAPARTKRGLTQSAVRALRSVQKQPQRVRSYFRQKDVSYAV